MASKQDILDKLTANQSVVLGKLSTIQAGINQVIAAGTGAADLDAVDAAVDASNTAVQSALDAVITTLPPQV